MKQSCKVLVPLGVAIASLLPGIRPSLAAEEVVITVGTTELATVPVTELATYAETGNPSGPLQSLLSFLSTEQTQTFRHSLSCEVTVNPEPFGQFLESRLGTLLLTELSQLLKPSDTSVTSLDALRTAMTTTATENGRISILSVVENYPTDRLILDQQTAQGRLDLLETLGEDAKLLMAALDLEADSARAEELTDEVAEAAEEFCVSPST